MSQQPLVPSAPEPTGHFRAFVLRFLTAYLLLYPLPFALPGLLGMAQFKGASDGIWQRFVPWLGDRLFGLDVLVRIGGSGDTLFHWLQVFSISVFALLASLIWLFVDREREHDRLIARWAVVGCRYYVASLMWIYGFNKVYMVQFPPLGLADMVRPLGEISPMKLAWTFMGYSPAYSAFSGWAEVIGGTLLFFRRTRTLGAAIVVAVMSNVLMLNLCYDIPVKLLSLHLLAMAAILLALDGRRLLNLLVLNRPTEPRTIDPHFPPGRLRKGALAIKIFFLAALLFGTVAENRGFAQMYALQQADADLYGIYRVEDFRLGGEVRPPLATDGDRWQRLIIDRGHRLRIDAMDGTSHHWDLRRAGNVLTLSSFENGSAGDSRQLRLERQDADRIVLTGDWNGRLLRVELLRRDPVDLPLVGRGFHWVQEAPFGL